MIRSRADELHVCIVGAGPVGSLSALLWSGRGARVTLLESRPDHVRPLGGEWLHPAAVDLLRQVLLPPQITRPAYETGRGFVVFPEDGSEPIALEYRENRRGTSLEHAALVEALRRAASVAPRVEFIPNARVSTVREQTIEFVHQGAARTLAADLIVGADGRASRIRPAAAGPRRQQLVSCMAGILLAGVAMPREGFGHVFVGAPGPMLSYRIEPDRVRICLDVPSVYCKQADLPAFLVEHYTPHLPGEWREPFRQALATGQIVWAKNEVEQRECYGGGGVRLVGDAVGCLHPITAGGLTLGFQDAACLVEHPSLDEYQTRRRAACRVPQALASALYAALSRRDEPARMIRRSIYRRWRESEAQRRDTVQLLCLEDVNPWQFRKIFFGIGALSVQTVLRDIVSTRGWRRPTVALQRLRRQVLWLGAPTPTDAPLVQR